jgi:hypothetical protein
VSSIPARYRSASQSHPDRELFSITESDRGLRCRSVACPSRGRVLDIRDGVRHAWRKISEAPVRLLIVTTVRLGQFLREIGRPLAAANAPPSPGERGWSRYRDAMAIGMEVPMTTQLSDCRFPADERPSACCLHRLRPLSLLTDRSKLTNHSPWQGQGNLIVMRP